MANIFIFGSNSLRGVPSIVTNWIEEYNRQNHNFLLRANEFSKILTMEMSNLGVPKEKVAIYSMNTIFSRDYFGYPIKQFISEYSEVTKEIYISELENKEYPNVNYINGTINEEEFIISNVENKSSISSTKEWTEFKDNRLIKDCDMAICIMSLESKTEQRLIRKLNIFDKPCYTFTI